LYALQRDFTARVRQGVDDIGKRESRCAVRTQSEGLSMFKAKFSQFFLMTSLALVLSPLAACSSAPPRAEAAATGTLSLPLVASSNGHTYRLSNAYIYISGPQWTQLFSSNDPEEKSLSATLQTGSYIAYLQGWSLERDDGSGNFVRVQAELVSSYAVGFSILNGTTSTVSYQFSTDGVIVTVGSGQLHVAVDVQERPAVCTPFADDCALGTWCPPTGLTGAPRACIATGSIAPGEPCSMPSECAANSSCFDLGTGPKCTELCPLDAVGTECSGGGTCQTAGPDYGVCGATPTE